MYNSSLSILSGKNRQQFEEERKYEKGLNVESISGSMTWRHGWGMWPIIELLPPVTKPIFAKQESTGSFTDLQVSFIWSSLNANRPSVESVINVTIRREPLSEKVCIINFGYVQIRRFALVKRFRLEGKKARKPDRCKILGTAVAMHTEGEWVGAITIGCDQL